MSNSSFNPLSYSASLVATKCPGIDQTVTPCSYLASPWSCPAGSYCLSPSVVLPCPITYYCPVNTSQPLWCPPGLVCATDTKSLDYCPVGSFCPGGTVNPIKCMKFLGLCLSKANTGTFNGIGFVLVLIFTPTLFVFFKIRDKVKTGKTKIQHSPPPKDEKELDVTLSFKDIRLEIDGKKLLGGITGKIELGKTLAIMGPSGAGKTTLIEVLKGRVTQTGGTVLVNNEVISVQEIRPIQGYVPQDDTMMTDCTVRDILLHSARTRLPAHWTESHIQGHVDGLLDVFGLKHVQNQVVGTAALRGISGGQRKRASIALELASNPRVLFLDEPTSGQDSSSALEICQKLKEMAQLQRVAIATVIHSPSPAIFECFDDLLLLAPGGRTVYNGSRAGALAYFESIGFTCPANESPADFYMQVLTGYVASEFDANFKLSDLTTYWETGRPHSFQNRERQRGGAQRRMLADAPVAPAANAVNPLTAYAKSCLNFYKDVGTEIMAMMKGKNQRFRKRASFPRQYFYFLKRALKQDWLNFQIAFLPLFVSFFLLLVISETIATISLQPPPPDPVCLLLPGTFQKTCFEANIILLTPQVALSFLQGCFLVGITLAAAIFGREKEVIWREAGSGIDSLAYYLAKVTSDIPRLLLVSTLEIAGYVTFYSPQQSIGALWLFSLGCNIYAFSIGYAVVNWSHYGNVGLYSIANLILWDILLGPPKTGAMKSIQVISGARWMSEYYSISELEAYDSLTTQQTQLYAQAMNYDMGRKSAAFGYTVIISLVFHFIALLGLKFKDWRLKK